MRLGFISRTVPLAPFTIPPYTSGCAEHDPGTDCNFEGFENVALLSSRDKVDRRHVVFLYFSSMGMLINQW